MNKIHPVSAIMNYRVYKHAMRYCPKFVIDVGGNGKMKNLFPKDVTVVDMNLPEYDGQNLHQVESNWCDVSMSVAVLEHVEEPKLFLSESYRICRDASIHWLPFGEWADRTEDIKRQAGHSHDCIIPKNIGYVNKYKCNVYPFITVFEHLTMLASLYEYMRKPFVYDFAMKHHDEQYGMIVEMMK